MNNEDLVKILKKLTPDQINFCLDWFEKNKNKEYCIKNGNCTICGDHVSRDDEGNDCEFCGWKICADCVNDNVDKDWEDFSRCKECFENRYEICSKGHEKELEKPCKECKRDDFSLKHMDLIKLAADDIINEIGSGYKLEENTTKGEIIIIYELGNGGKNLCKLTAKKWKDTFVPKPINTDNKVMICFEYSSNGCFTSYTFEDYRGKIWNRSVKEIKKALIGM